MHSLWRAALAGGCVVGLTGVPAVGEVIPTLWGVDEENARLFSVGNYRSALTSYTDYGLLKYNDHGVIRNIGGPDTEAFALRNDGNAFMVFNDDLGPYHQPVLLRFNIGTANATGPNVATVVGPMNVTFRRSSDAIDGLAFQPGTNLMYAIFQRGGKGGADRLLKVDPLTGTVTNVGVIKGRGKKVKLGKDLAFDGDGRLYVIDDKTDAVYRINPATAAIMSTFDSKLAGGLGVGKNVKFEGLAWDPVNDRLIASEEKHSIFAEITKGKGHNVRLADYSQLGLLDVEGIGFPSMVPSPGGLALLGIAALGSRRRRCSR